MKKSKTSAIIVGLILFFVNISFSAIINVPGDSTTIQSAINGTSAGDTVLVAPGTYTEIITYPTHRIIVYTSQGPDSTFIQHPGGAEDLINIGDSDSGSVFAGFSVNNVQDGDNLIHASGIAEYFEIKGNRFIADSVDDIIRGDNNASLDVQRNVFSNSAKGNIIVTLGPDCRFINNTVDGGRRGLAIFGLNATILNNIIVNIDQYGIYDTHESSIIDYNDCWNNGSHNDPGLNGISVNPLFENPSNYNYQLNENSPCIDAGHPDLIYLDPDGSRNDMGAIPFYQVPIASNFGPDNEDSYHVINHTPTFCWQFIDTIVTQEGYEIEVGTNESWDIAEMWSTGEVISNDTFVVYSGLALVDGETYFARLRVSDIGGWGEWATTSFRMNSIPSIPNLVYPISQMVVTITNVQLYIDASSDPESDILAYDFELYADSDLTILVESIYDSDSTHTDYIEGLLPDSEYWWRARAYDGYEHSDWSEPESFLTRGSWTVNVPDDYETIQDAINASKNGDTVLVSPGEYTENIDFTGKSIALISAESAIQTTLQPLNPDERTITLCNGRIGVSSISGFHIYGSYDTSCVISGIVKIENNIFTDNALPIIVIGDSSHVLIQRNLFYNNECFNWGKIIKTDKTSKTSVYNNTISGDAYFFQCYGIYASSDSDDVRNNIVVNIQAGIYSHSGNNDYSYYNNVWVDSIYVPNNYIRPGINGISVNPQFVDTSINNYSLQPLSLCIDAGDPDSQFKDPDGTIGDMGTFYYSSTLPVAENISFSPYTEYGYIGSFTPEIQWDYFDTASSSQSQYQLQVNTENDWSGAEFWDSGPVASSATSIIYAGLPLPNKNTFYVRIKVHNGLEWGSWRYRKFVLGVHESIRVPTDQPTIQAGIDSAFDGDTVLVEDGTYTGDGNRDITINREIILKSENGPENTIIDCQGDSLSNHRAFILDDNDKIDGFKIIGGYAENGGGIKSGGAALINNCVFEGNSAYANGGAIYTWESPVNVIKCKFISNTARWWGGGICFESCNDTVDNCIFIGNKASRGSGVGIVDCYYSNTLVRSSTFCGNLGEGIGVEWIWTNNGCELSSSKFQKSQRVTIEKCLTACNQGIGIHNSGDMSISVFCCNSFDNLGGNYVIRYPDTANCLSFNPRFCDTANGDLHLAANSPCLPENNICGVLIGALDAACDSIFDCGDINGDDVVNLFDVTYLISYLYMEGPPPTDLLLADVNGDETINIFDITYLITYLYLEGPEPDCS